MPQLIVRGIEEKVVRKLKQRAGEHGISMEEEHRRILRDALLGRASQGPSWKEHLLAMPKIGPDELFARQKDFGREIDL